jgi:hypothetical protein
MMSRVELLSLHSSLPTSVRCTRVWLALSTATPWSSLVAPTSLAALRYLLGAGDQTTQRRRRRTGHRPDDDLRRRQDTLVAGRVITPQEECRLIDFPACERCSTASAMAELALRASIVQSSSATTSRSWACRSLRDSPSIRMWGELGLPARRPSRGTTGSLKRYDERVGATDDDRSCRTSCREVRAVHHPHRRVGRVSAPTLVT